MLALLSAIFFTLDIFSLFPKPHGLEVRKVLSDVTHNEDVTGISVGVGFDLTASYGIAAMSYPNGTRSTIVKISGAPEYQELLSRLSLASSTHPAPPYSDAGEMYRDQRRREKRRARKAEGLPASEDVAGHLGHRVNSAVVTVPHLLVLYSKDLHNAFEYLGPKCLDIPVRYGLLRETSGAYAGYVFGLYFRYAVLPACKAEQRDAPADVITAVLYTCFALTVTLSVTKSAYYPWEPPSRRIEGFSLQGEILLGTSSRPIEGDHGEALVLQEA